MDYPKFLGPAVPLNVGGAGGGPAGSDHHVANFSLHCQEFTNWCWASVVQSVERAFASNPSQEDIASDHIRAGRPGEHCRKFDPGDVTEQSCGANNCASPCNAPHSMKAILTERARLAPDGFLMNGLSFAVLEKEVRNNRPVPCRIEWPDGMGAHFVCVAGVSTSGPDARFVHVYDPLSPGIGLGVADRLTMRFETFLDRYVDRSAAGIFGKHTHSYLVE